jgi:hypothetical protein
MNDKKSDNERKGPIVKTGPTRGEERSRNQDGRWREKRSDAGKPRESKRDDKGKKGCFLTTAACEHRGLPDDCFELSTMRDFRDRVLLETPAGQAMVKHYYDVAPGLVPLMGDGPTAEWAWKHIQETVNHISEHRNEAAIDCYRDLVAVLSRRAALVESS